MVGSAILLFYTKLDPKISLHSEIRGVCNQPCVVSDVAYPSAFDRVQQFYVSLRYVYGPYRSGAHRFSAPGYDDPQGI